MTERKPYGTELIMDLHGCDLSVFTKESLDRYIIDVCELIGINRHGDPMYWFDESGIEHLNGVSAVQFLTTSTLVIHGINMMQTVLVNLFSCNPFETDVAAEFTKNYFKAQDMQTTVVTRR